MRPDGQAILPRPEPTSSLVHLSSDSAKLWAVWSHARHHFAAFVCCIRWLCRPPPCASSKGAWPVEAQDLGLRGLLAELSKSETLDKASGRLFGIGSEQKGPRRRYIRRPERALARRQDRDIFAFTAVAVDWNQDGWTDVYIACDSTRSLLCSETTFSERARMAPAGRCIWRGAWHLWR